MDWTVCGQRNRMQCRLRLQITGNMKLTGGSVGYGGGGSRTSVPDMPGPFGRWSVVALALAALWRCGQYLGRIDD